MLLHKAIFNWSLLCGYNEELVHVRSSFICLLHGIKDMGPQWERSLAEDTITDLFENKADMSFCLFLNGSNEFLP